MTPTAHLLTALFAAWDEVGVRYAILRNYEELPEVPGNDIDVLIDPDQKTLAGDTLRSAVEQVGWRIHNVVEYACTAYFLYDPVTLEQVHIDLMCGLKWHALTFLDHRPILERRRRERSFYVPAHVDEAAVSLLTRLIYSGYVKPEYRAQIQQVARETGPDFQATLEPLVARELAVRVVAWCAAGRWGAIESRRWTVRWKVFTRNVLTPCLTVKALAHDIGRIARRWWRPPGTCIALIGPDGSGKSAIAEGVKQRLVKTYPAGKVLHCHWKPLRRRGPDALPTTDPHGKPPRSRLLSLFYFGYHLAGFIYGWSFHVRPMLFRGGLIIIERYYYDFFVDLRRYRLTLPDGVVVAGLRLMGKPHHVFVLLAEPEILLARKCEVTTEECARQCQRYRQLAERLPQARIVDAGKSVGALESDIMTTVLGRSVGQ